MTITIEKEKIGPEVSEEEVRVAVENIFKEVGDAINKNGGKGITFDSIDSTLKALFDAINKAHQKGKGVEIPDFRTLIKPSE